ncbi:MAG: sigma-54-dependent Fis family transcriptional regulator [Nitrospirae bacterium]|nr:sigma-54-dependent Fis family transcriptional regulator [Nitrospirota bacterium]
MENKGRILIVEDEKSMREVLKILLEDEGYEILSASDGQDGIRRIQEDIFDIVITDIKMPKADGFEVLKKVKEISPTSIVIMITAFGTTESTIEAMKLGAYDYIHKPFKIDEIRLIINKAFEKKRLSEEISVLREKVQTTYRIENIIGKSPRMQELFRLIPKVAQSSSTVLITGESGCGKELVAAALHNLSTRKNKNFVTINCATFPEGLLETELFGHVKGSFTGAVQNKEGLFEIADQGTILLDEIAEMPLSLQPKLLRVLENGTFRRVGGVADITVDVRVISATNRNLSDAIAAGSFREDLFYRLNVIPLQMPPLRERPEDIPLLLDHFFRKFSGGAKRLSSEALRILMKYPWKGNVRELENMVERVVLLTEGNTIFPDDLPEEFFTVARKESGVPDLDEEGVDLEKIIEEIEKGYLLKALAKSNGSKTDAAKLLNLTFRSFRHRLYKYGIK